MQRTMAERKQRAAKVMFLRILFVFLSDNDSSHYSAHVCQGIALLLRKNFGEALAELEQALLRKNNDTWEAYFWKGMTYAFLGQDEEATAAIEKALELELPPILLTPLRWFEQERPDFYEKQVVPLLAKHG